jgi:hypothetical protein
VPPDSVRCTRGLQLKLVALGNFQRQLRYNSPDMSGAPRKGGLRNSPASGFHSSRSAIIRRTVRCTPDCPVHLWSNGYDRRQRLPATAFNARAARSESESPMPAHRTVNSACPVRHRTSRRAQKSELQRSISNGTGDVAGAPDCPVCTGLSGVPSNRRPPEREMCPWAISKYFGD